MHVLVIGAGPTGLALAVMLARDGNRVTVLERDAGAPTGWLRPPGGRGRVQGVSQFRHPHLLLPAVFRTLRTEIPEVLDELTAMGLRPGNLLDGARRSGILDGPRAGDERFEMMDVRRPLFEAALDAVAGRTAGLTVRRCTRVRALLAGREAGIAAAARGGSRHGGRRGRARGPRRGRRGPQLAGGPHAARPGCPGAPGGAGRVRLPRLHPLLPRRARDGVGRTAVARRPLRKCLHHFLCR